MRSQATSGQLKESHDIRRLGHDMGEGCKTYGGGGPYQVYLITYPPENFWTKSSWSALSWILYRILYRNNRATRRRGDPKPLLGRGVLREVFYPPLFVPLCFSSTAQENSGMVLAECARDSFSALHDQHAWTATLCNGRIDWPLIALPLYLVALVAPCS